MKTKIFGGIAIVVIAVLATINISISIDKRIELPNLSLTDVEAHADGFWSEVGDAIVNIAQGQGATKDEREIREKCPTSQSSSGGGSVSGGNGAVGGSASGSGSSSQTNPPERTDIRCASGTVNCTPVSC